MAGHRRFTTDELSTATLAPPFPWTKNVPILKVPVTERSPMYNNYGPGALLERETRLYDLLDDPGQERPIHLPEVEARLLSTMKALMRQNDAPEEAFQRLALG